MRWMALVLLVAACGHKAEAPSPLADADKAFGAPFDGVYVGKDALYVNRKKVAALGEIGAKRDEIAKLVADRKDLLISNSTPTAPDLFALLQALPDGKRVKISFVDANLTMQPLCKDFVRDTSKRSPDEGDVRLSVLLTPDRVWIGLSRVNEFQEITPKGPDLDAAKLTEKLNEHKVSAFFSDRKDAELSLEEVTKGADLLAALGSLCNVGFTTLAVPSADKLTAAPRL